VKSETIRRLVVGSRYSLTAIRTAAEGWRTSHFKSTPMWSRGNKGLWEVIERNILCEGS